MTVSENSLGIRQTVSQIQLHSDGKSSLNSVQGTVLQEVIIERIKAKATKSKCSDMTLCG